MYHLIERARRRRARGFTLVELLVVIVVLAVLAAIVLPKFVDSSKRSKESALKSDLKLLRNAITLFHTDTGVYPASLADLAATSAPATGAGGAPITATDWHGPYLQEIPTDPISGSAFSYNAATGTVTSSAGAPYNTW